MGLWLNGDFNGDGVIDQDDSDIFCEYAQSPGFSASPKVQTGVPTLSDGSDETFDRVEYTYNRAAEQKALKDQLERTTSYDLDGLGRVVKVTEPDPDGPGGGSAAWTVTAYDVRGNVESVTDRADHSTAYGYDDYNRRTSETDANNHSTQYAYDDAGRMTSLTDPNDNETVWQYDELNRVVSETNESQDPREFVYDGGLLWRQVDRLGRVREFTYDAFGRNIGEYWYATVAAADADSDHNDADYSIGFSYNAVGQMLTAEDDAASYEYEYDGVGRMVEETQSLADLSPTVVVLTSEYDMLGNRTQLAVEIGETDDFVNQYEYDAMGRLTSVEQHGVSLGNAVAEKRVDFTYDAAGQYDTVIRHKDLDGGTDNEVMTGTYGFDLAGRLTDLAYTHYDSPPTTVRSFAWTYDVANRIIGHDSDIASEDVADGDYTYDAANQLTGADYADANRDDESYSYDDNGNRSVANGTAYGDAGPDNRLTTDGTYTYKYDDEGNLEYRFVDEDELGTLNTGDTDITQYTWDHRNRLSEVTHREVFGQSVNWSAEYVYDAFDRRIGSLYDTDGDSTLDREERYVWDGKNVVLDFVDPDGGDNGEESAPLTLAKRYLWGDAVDQLLAEESVDDGGPEDVVWPATDNLGSVRSLVSSLGQITSTYSYDTFGKVTVLAGSLTDSRYLYTCQEYDLTTGSYYYDARWYDPAVGKFVSLDPIIPFFSDVNSYRYVYNIPTDVTDPTGEAAEPLHHPYPLHLGGRMAQDVIPLSEAQHQAAHRYFSSKGFPFGDAGRAAWGRLTARQQQAHVMRALRAAGVDNATIKAHIGDILKGATPGDKVSRLGSVGKVIGVGTVASALLIVLTDPSTAQAAEIPKDWRQKGTAYWGKGECKCECADYRYSMIVPSWWTIGYNVEYGETRRAGQWADYGDMNVDECRELEGNARVIQETWQIGFSIYNVEESRCRFNGVLYGAPWPDE